jgi:RNA polymerase sigma factor (sigma-70 family)
MAYGFARARSSVNAIDAYHKELHSEFIVADKETVLEWCRQYKQTGNLEYRDLVVKSVLKWVVVMARKFAANANAKEHLEELIQEGNIGVLEAIEAFNTENYDAAFITYAAFHIKKRIYIYLLNSRNTIRKPGSVYYKLRKLQIRQKENPESMDESSLAELVRLERLFLDTATVSLSEPVVNPEGDGVQTWESKLQSDSDPYKSLEEIHTRQMIDIFMKKTLEIFPEREAKVFFSIMGWDDGNCKTLSEAAEVNGEKRWVAEKAWKRIPRSSALRSLLKNSSVRSK